LILTNIAYGGVRTEKKRAHHKKASQKGLSTTRCESGVKALKAKMKFRTDSTTLGGS